MKQFKTFMITFTVAFCIMLMAYTGLYWFMQYSSPQAVGEAQQGVPVLSLTPDDTKTVLAVMDGSDARFYFLVQLNAIQGTVNVVSVPGSFYLSVPQRTLNESMDYAGVRQCVQDLSRQFDIAVDYYLVGDETALGNLAETFAPLDTESVTLPQSVKQYLLKGSRYVDVNTLAAAVAFSPSLLDNGVGIDFMNTVADKLLQDNLHKLKDDVPQNIKDNFAQLDTDLGTQQLEQLKRIVRLLEKGAVQHGRLVLTQTDTAQAEIDRILKE
ncbi:MAG: hypothetical protein E7484_06100 [Ruminococcaceae bacterium]|nr:hypothetical protein [Oscillospiraceae bacterium]